MNEQLLEQLQQLVCTMPSFAAFEKRLERLQVHMASSVDVTGDEEANDKVADVTDTMTTLIEDLIDAITNALASEAYKQDVRYIEQLQMKLQAENEALHTVRDIAEQQAAANAHGPIVLQQWIQQHGQQLHQQLPIAQWQQALHDYHTLTANIAQFNAQAIAYTSERYIATSSFTKRLLLSRKKRRALHAEGKHLQTMHAQLTKDVALFAQNMDNIRTAWQLHAPVIAAFYNDAASSASHQTYVEKAAQQLKRNNEAFNELARIMRIWRPYVELHALLQSVQQQYAVRTTHALSFPHALTYAQLEQMLQRFNDALSQPVVTTSQWQQQTLIVPTIDEEIFDFQAAPIRSYRGFITVPVTIAVLAGSYFWATTSLSDEIDTFTSSFTTANEDPTSTSDAASSAAASVEPTSASTTTTGANIQPDGVRQTVGYIVASHGNVPIYSHPDADKAPIGYLNAGETYKVLAVSERMRMKLSNNEWVIYDKDDVRFEQQELEARLQPIYAPLHEATVTSKTVPVFSEPTRNSDVIGYLEDVSTVTIYNTAVGEWIDVGNNAWVEEMKYLSISWPYAANAMANPIGQLTVTTSQFLNVRNKPGISGQIVGRLDEYETVYIYGIDQATGWLQVGEDGWVSGESKYVNYDVY